MINMTSIIKLCDQNLFNDYYMANIIVSAFKS